MASSYFLFRKPIMLTKLKLGPLLSTFEIFWKDFTAFDKVSLVLNFVNALPVVPKVKGFTCSFRRYSCNCHSMEFSNDDDEDDDTEGSLFTSCFG
jgi:hypothetical protein